MEKYTQTFKGDIYSYEVLRKHLVYIHEAALLSLLLPFFLSFFTADFNVYTYIVIHMGLCIGSSNK